MVRHPFSFPQDDSPVVSSKDKNPGSAPHRNDVELVSRETLFQRFFRIDRYLLRHRRFDGSMTEMLDREVFERGHAAGALPYDPRRDQVVLIRQFRPGAYAAGAENPWLTEIVAGIIEDGETAENVARRETLEETGLTVTRTRHVVDYYVSPGGATESVRLYCVEVNASEASVVAGCADEGEDIEVLVMTADEAIALLDSNRINNAVSVVALQWLARHRQQLRADWLETTA